MSANLNERDRHASTAAFGRHMHEMVTTFPASNDAAQRRKWIFWAIRGCCMMTDAVKSEIRLALFRRAASGLALITPRELMTVYPPDKIYDGERYECKDYFSTMEAVNEHGMDAPIGDHVFKFLWDYMNADTREYCVRCLGAIDDDRLAIGEPGLAEEFLANEGIPTYTKLEGPDGREYMQSHQTGEIHAITRPKPKVPRWWKVIEGGAS